MDAINNTFQFTPDRVQDALNGSDFWLHQDCIEALIIQKATEAGYIRRISHTQAEWTDEGEKWFKEVAAETTRIEKIKAAAPELLEALQGTMKALKTILDKFDPDAPEYDWIGEAHEAIQKATN